MLAYKCYFIYNFDKEISYSQNKRKGYGVKEEP